MFKVILKYMKNLRVVWVAGDHELKERVGRIGPGILCRGMLPLT